MNKQDKPRICEVLWVEVGERFDFCDVRGEYYNNVRVDSDGKIRFSEGMGDYLLSAGNVCYLINHPESIVRRKRFTEQEVEDAKNIRRIYSADKVYRSAEGKLAISLSKASLIAVINPDLFPSIAPGESYTLDGIIGRCE